MLDAFLMGLFLGVLIAVPIGPANLELIKRALKGRPREAFGVGLGTALSDALLALLVYFGVVPLLFKIGIVKQFFYAGGGVMLIAVGCVSLYQAYANENPLEPPETSAADPFTERYRNLPPVSLGFLINTTNPMVVGFWIGFISSALGHRLLGRHAYELLLFSGGVLLGSLAWFAALAALVASGRRYVGRLAYLAVSTVCDATLVAAGAYFLVCSLGLSGRGIP